MDGEARFHPRGSKAEVEEGLVLSPRFGPDGLIPVVTTDYDSGELLMHAYMNAEALAETLACGEAVYWSRSRQEQWHKGATSGHVQKVVEVRTDCDQDTIWLRVRPAGGACCHVGYRSCFYRSIVSDDGESGGRLRFEEAEKVFDPAEVYGRKNR